eukprot:m.391037 g.391037  ORF g.391037 m.391037 type:complete len:854 (+) comp20079_c0_seq11:3410-5971(+)
MAEGEARAWHTYYVFDSTDEDADVKDDDFDVEDWEEEQPKCFVRGWCDEGWCDEEPVFGPGDCAWDSDEYADSTDDDVDVEDDSGEGQGDKRRRTADGTDVSDQPAKVSTAGTVAAKTAAMEQATFIAVDIETSSTSRYLGSIIQLGMVVCDRHGPRDGDHNELCLSIKPDKDYDQFDSNATSVHGIDSNSPQLQNAPTFPKAWAQVCQWLNERAGDKLIVLIGHNFEAVNLDFLLGVLQRHNLDLPPTVTYFFDPLRALLRYKSNRALDDGDGDASVGSPTLGRLDEIVTGQPLDDHHDALVGAHACATAVASGTTDLWRRLPQAHGMQPMEGAWMWVKKQEAKRAAALNHKPAPGWRLLGQQETPPQLPGYDGSGAGPAGAAKDAETLVDLFLSFIDLEFWEQIAQESNRHLSTKPIQGVKEIDVWVLLSVVGALLQLSGLGAPSFRRSWSLEWGPANNAFVNNMPYSVFTGVLARWCVAGWDEAASTARHGGPSDEVFAKVKPLVAHINRTSKQNWTLGPHVAIDEYLIARNGRCSKVNQRLSTPGIKVVRLCGADSYIYDTQLNGGARSRALNRGETVVDKLVMDMVLTIKHSNRVVFFDNVCTSVGLAASLLEVGLFSVGLARLWRQKSPDMLEPRDFPFVAPKKNPHLDSVPSGFCRTATRTLPEGTVQAELWKDSSWVGIVHTAFLGPSLETSVVKRHRRSTTVTFSAPAALVKYSTHMNRIDLAKRGLAACSTQHNNGRCWSSRIMHDVLDRAVHNAYKVAEARQLEAEPVFSFANEPVLGTHRHMFQMELGTELVAFAKQQAKQQADNGDPWWFPRTERNGTADHTRSCHKNVNWTVVDTHPFT